jgi:hypothetical protein
MLFKGCSPLQFLCNLIENHPHSTTYNTANRYVQESRQQQHHDDLQILFFPGDSFYFRFLWTKYNDFD